MKPELRQLVSQRSDLVVSGVGLACTVATAIWGIVAALSRPSIVRAFSHSGGLITALVVLIALVEFGAQVVGLVGIGLGRRWGFWCWIGVVAIQWMCLGTNAIEDLIQYLVLHKHHQWIWLNYLPYAINFLVAAYCVVRLRQVPPPFRPPVASLEA